MKTVIAVLLTLLALNAFSAQVNGNVDHSVVNNLSSKKIKASIIYFFNGHAKFTDRIIDPGTHAADEYNDGICRNASDYTVPIGVLITLVPAGCQTEVYIDCDESVVILNNPKGQGVDIYASQYGDINKPAALLHTLKCP